MYFISVKGGNTHRQPSFTAIGKASYYKRNPPATEILATGGYIHSNCEDGLPERRLYLATLQRSLLPSGHSTRAM